MDGTPNIAQSSLANYCSTEEVFQACLFIFLLTEIPLEIPMSPLWSVFVPQYCAIEYWQMTIFQQMKCSQASLLIHILIHRDPVGDTDVWSIVIGISHYSGTILHVSNQSKILTNFAPSLRQVSMLVPVAHSKSTNPLHQITFKMDESCPWSWHEI